MSEPSIHGAVLDHVAHAVPRWQDVWERYAVDLGAEWSSGGPGPGFAPAQLAFGNGARIEVLMPNDVEVNDFLARFLAHSGPGPHHLTFKVPELDTALGLLRVHGFEPIRIDRSDPEWLEAFIHPKQAAGVVVQIAEAPNSWSSPAPDDYPVGRRRRRDGTGAVAPARLHRVTHVVADLGAATALFVDLLGGRVVDEGKAPDSQWSELTWGVPLGIRLVEPSAAPSGAPLRRWLGDRAGRVHHLDIEAEEPGDVAGAVPSDLATAGSGLVAGPADVWEIPPGDNAGLRLVLRPVP